MNNPIFFSRFKALPAGLLFVTFIIGTIVALYSESSSADESNTNPKNIQRGEELFAYHCVHCHDDRGPGTRALKSRLGVDKALLAERPDLNADYIQLVVRRGLLNMPWYRKTELPDAELDALVAYLTRNSTGE